MIQILGLRPWFNEKKQIWDKKDTFVEEGWRAVSVGDILRDPDRHLENVPLEERYNLYFTVAECHEGKGRKLARQSVLPFDIDHVPAEQAKEVLFRATQAMGLVFEEVGSLYSGHGVQFFVQLETGFDSVEYFDEVRPHYKHIVDKIQQALKANNLPGDVDPSVWSPARLMRMPNTINKKPEKGLPDAQAFVINAEMKPLAYDLKERSGLPVVAGNEQISPKFLAMYPEIDVDAVEKGCEFLKHCLANPNSVREPQWYAMLSIVGKFPNGENYAHAYSRGHDRYNPHETKAKLEQATAASGPRTCKNIDALWDGCKGCKHYGTKLSSPIMIQGENYIKTKATGFHDMVRVKDTDELRPGKPNVSDLHKYFKQKHVYLTTAESQQIYVYEEPKWREYLKPYALNFADRHFHPPVMSVFCQEFHSKIVRNNLHDHRWFAESTEGKINFRNGTYDTRTRLLQGHSPDNGFRYVLDYDFDPQAECPRFDKFMDEITEGREAFKTLLLEFAGYALSGDAYWMHKALFMTGQGANGKSTFMNILRMLAGEGNYSEINSTDMQDPASRYPLDGALFNLSEETSVNSLVDSAVFKAASAGGPVKIKKLYAQPYSIANTAKLIYSCNGLPDLQDHTFAMFRRMIIIPFTANFYGREERGLEETLYSERPGIFNRMMKAYLKAKQVGHFSETEETRTQVEQYRDEQDFVCSWFFDNYEVLDKGAWETFTVSKSDVYMKYSEAARFQSGERVLSESMFWRRIKNRVMDLDARARRLREGSARVQTLAGIKPRTENKEKF